MNFSSPGGCSLRKGVFGDQMTQETVKRANSGFAIVCCLQVHEIESRHLTMSKLAAAKWQRANCVKRVNSQVAKLETNLKFKFYWQKYKMSLPELPRGLPQILSTFSECHTFYCVLNTCSVNKIFLNPFLNLKIFPHGESWPQSQGSRATSWC